MSGQQALRADIHAVLERGLVPLPDEIFNALALRVFQFQFEHNLPYRRYCERRIGSVGAVTRWQDIPAVPTAAFKEARLVAGTPDAAQAVFLTSGTTRGAQRRGAHYVLDLALYDAAALPAFRAFVLGGRTPVPMLSLVPDARAAPDSSLSYMVSVVMRELGSADSRVAIDERGISYDVAVPWLEQQQAADAAVCVIGTSLAFVHFFEQLAEGKRTFALPPGSVIMDTGGFKGSDRAISAAELRARYQQVLGVSASRVVNEYGMTEMLSQFYDVGAVKRGPPWVRSTIVDPESLAELPAGETGLLRHVDLANLFSVAAIQTEDLGRSAEDGFELLGRVAGAAPRGCSIAMDIFLGATR